MGTVVVSSAAAAALSAVVLAMECLTLSTARELETIRCAGQFLQVYYTWLWGQRNDQNQHTKPIIPKSTSSAPQPA
jgi:hypothetical protein